MNIYPDGYYAYVFYDPSRNNEPFYVGKGKEKRAWVHFYKPLQRRCQFYSRLKSLSNKGVVPIIGLYNFINEETALLAEIQLISLYGRKDLNQGTLLNKTNGGEGCSGVIQSEETKAKRSATLKGRKRSKETVAKMSASMKGRKRSPEAIAKQSNTTKGVKFSPEEKLRRYGSRIGKKGRKHTQETKDHLSAVSIGRKVSEETVRKREATKANNRARKALVEPDINTVSKEQPQDDTTNSNTPRIIS